jgi:hypothetical protein
MYLRVHICPVSYEVDRIVEPLIRKRADKAYLVTKRVVRAKDKAKNFLLRIEKKLDEAGITHELRECDLDDFYDCMKVVGDIVEDETGEGNHVFINISSGGRILSHASAVAGMMQGAELYYAKPEEDLREGKEFTKGLEAIIDIPPFKIESPDDVDLDCLEALVRHNGKASKKVLINDLVGLGSMDASSGSIQTLYSAMNRICARLVMKGLIVESGRTRAKKVEITLQGRKVLSGFRDLGD